MYRTLVLSLKKDTKRRQHTIQLLNKLEIEFEFFDAYTPENLNYFFSNIYCSKIEIGDKVNKGAVYATFYSHLQILKDIFNSKTHTLVLEDDLVLEREFDFKNIDFNSFDVLQLMSEISCCSQFVNWKAAGNILFRLKKAQWYPTQAFDWELHKLREEFNIQTVDTPVFSQSSKFISNLAPYGY